MTNDLLEQYFEENPKGFIQYGITDIDGMLRGKWISVEKAKKALSKGIGFCDVIFGWDIQDQCIPDLEVTGWQSGYPDAFAIIDPMSFRSHDSYQTQPLLLADFEHSDGLLSSICPRSLLKRMARKAHQAGFAVEYAQEFEWFNFAESPESLYDKNYQDPVTITEGMFGYSLLRLSKYQYLLENYIQVLQQLNIPLEGFHTETGPGVYEAALQHTAIVEAADQATLFKFFTKKIFQQNGILPSFMSKWNPQLPGCGGHIHQSIWNLDKTQNLFYDPEMPNGISTLMQQFIAGQLYCLPHILPMYAPTTNSYKRLQPGTWAPTSLSWGIENRTTAVRAITQDPENIRVEMRVPGADTNPYLAMAAALASGLYGIEHRLTLSDATSGTAYEDVSLLPLPDSLLEATSRMAQSTIAKELFGYTFVEHFTKTRFWEVHQQQDHPTWELQRYLEAI